MTDLKKLADSDLKIITSQHQMICDLIDEKDKLKADAERYAWLRKMHDVCDDEITLWHVRGDDGQPVNFGRLDDAIDNAMKEVNK